MNTYLEVKISAENQAQADRILDSILDKKLATGGQFITSPARFLWKEKIEDMNYVYITSYTIAKNKTSIIQDVQKTSVEDVPMISFSEIAVNNQLANWIDKTLS